MSKLLKFNTQKSTFLGNDIMPHNKREKRREEELGRPGKI
tara:strand:+ start:278 stop:397 length:120 start_codon:yes stop_codon:yes gene_type:complete